MRAAKERKRLARVADGWTPEPQMVRWFPLELGIRDKATGECAWIDLKSARDAAKRIGMILKYYTPGLRGVARR
jgi:cobalamin biosynthesis Mg chelatase CobN